MSKCPVVKRGIELPVLTKPAKAGNIESGYQAIDGNGKMITGTLTSLGGTMTFTSPTGSYGQQQIQLPGNYKNCLIRPNYKFPVYWPNIKGCYALFLSAVLAQWCVYRGPNDPMILTSPEGHQSVSTSGLVTYSYSNSSRYGGLGDNTNYILYYW